MYSAEQDGEEQGAAHVQVHEGLRAQAVHEDCCGALGDALQVYAQLCRGKENCQARLQLPLLMANRSRFLSAWLKATRESSSQSSASVADMSHMQMSSASQSPRRKSFPWRSDSPALSSLDSAAMQGSPG